MPTYEYLCETCGHRFEHFQSMNDAKLTVCPLTECAGTVKRLLGTGAGLIFKGSGFYQTDHRSQSYQAGAKSETKSETTPSSGDSSSSSSDSSASSASGDTKPAPKKNPAPQAPAANQSTASAPAKPQSS